jgi:RES domain-containing protein
MKKSSLRQLFAVVAASDKLTHCLSTNWQPLQIDSHQIAPCRPTACTSSELKTATPETQSMPSREPPEIVALFNRIQKLLPLAVAFDGVIVRSVELRYANERDFISGEGAAERGGRWNRPGILAVYGSLEIMTAVHEAYQNFLDAGFSLSAIRPRGIAGASAKLNVLCDLTATTTRRKIGFTREELLDEDWQAIQAAGEESWTQAIGRGCRIAGFEGLLVPSARHRSGRNIVIFPDQLLRGSRVSVLAAKDLPPHPDQSPE